MKKSLIILALLGLLLGVSITTVFAASKTATQQYLNFWEGINAYAWKKAETNSQDTSFRGRIRSYTTGGTIWDIGWDWWSVQQWCGSTPWFSYNYPGHLLHDTDNAASTSPYYSIFACANRQARVNGEHYFHHGPVFWEPNFTLSMNLP